MLERDPIPIVEPEDLTESVEEVLAPGGDQVEDYTLTAIMDGIDWVERAEVYVSLNLRANRIQCDLTIDED